MIAIHQDEIVRAITDAQKGIKQYLEVMDNLYSCDVSQNKNFQKRFNAFYRIRQRSPEWYDTYYKLLEHYKLKNEVEFKTILHTLHKSLGRYEPSFSSKLVATIHPDLPIWDKYVLENCNITPPSYSSKHKLSQAVLIYQNLVKWYAEFISSEEAKKMITVFKNEVRDHDKISDLKKIDFILWKIR